MYNLETKHIEMSDWYQVGILFYELIYGFPPYFDKESVLIE